MIYVDTSFCDSHSLVETTFPSVFVDAAMIQLLRLAATTTCYSVRKSKETRKNMLMTMKVQLQCGVLGIGLFSHHFFW